MPELPKAYEPEDVETKWYSAWLEAGCFRADEDSSKEAYSIVIPPPNVTGILHLGHVLNNSIQDILARRARQQGKEVLWLPGTDHAGIATQTKVEREIRKKEKLTRRDLGREKFLERVWDWKDEHGGIIIKQLKRLGCSCDWGRERFTMDPEYSEWVSKVFTDLFNEGLIYRGKRMVNWCPVSLTALSDEEVIMKPQKSTLYYMSYEFVDAPGEFLEISTTRPETLMGDVAVAVNPKDERFSKHIGRKVRRPFPEAEIPVIGDEAVDIEFGTGALKITPAHDKVDFEVGQRHDLEIIDVLHADGKINCPDMPELDGLDRFVARKKAAEILEERGLLIKAEDYENNVGFSERAGVPVEPRISMQWFLKYPCVEETAQAVASNEIAFRPLRWQKTFAHWMGNIQDWCISRQLWWGHQIPVWYRKDKAGDLQEAESLDVKNQESGDIYVGVEPPVDSENWVRDEDVMDTWFSSWLWPFATMDEKTRGKFYPTADLVTGPDIIFFWVARMIMAGYRFADGLPFKNVFYTSIVRDLKGRKMSKSLGNSPDPIDLIEQYGADGLRFGLLRIAPVGSDVKFDERQVEEGRNFANKIYNACRFRQMVEAPSAVRPELPISGGVSALTAYHCEVLCKFDAMVDAVEKAYVDYKFNEVAQQLYEFLWGDFCDRFLEAVKGDFREDGDLAAKDVTLQVFDSIMSRYFQYLHPFMPHITEELSLRMGYLEEGSFLMQKLLPGTPLISASHSATVEVKAKRAMDVYTVAAKLRNLKSEYGVASRRDVNFIVKPQVDWLESEVQTLALLSGAAEVKIDSSFEAEKGVPVSVTDLGDVFMPLDGLIDVEGEKERLGKELQKVEAEIIKSNKKLGNENFISRAKPEVVDVERARLAEWVAKQDQLKERLEALN